MFRVFIRVIFGKTRIKTRIKTRMKFCEEKILINKEGYNVVIRVI